MLEVPSGGVLIEAGLKSVAEYGSAAAVLGNPEIAHHLTLDSVLYDLDGLLRDLQEQVRRDYPRRRWVLARIEHERRGQAGALGLRPMAREWYGASGEAQVLGYSSTYIGALMGVATLNPPTIGGRMLLRLRERLLPFGRLDLYEELLAVQGLAEVGPDRVARLLGEAAAVFDVAVAVRRTPHPFQHKLHAHLPPYFVESCQGMLDEGYHREALGWVIPFACAATDVVLVDGPEAERAQSDERRAGLLREIGMETAEARATKFDQAIDLYDRFFALAEEIVAIHPGIVD